MDVSPKIRQFCGNFPIFKVEETTLEQLEKRAQKYISGNDNLFYIFIFFSFYAYDFSLNSQWKDLNEFFRTLSLLAYFVNDLSGNQDKEGAFSN